MSQKRAICKALDMLFFLEGGGGVTRFLGMVTRVVYCTYRLDRCPAHSGVAVGWAIISNQARGFRLTLDVPLSCNFPPATEDRMESFFAPFVSSLLGIGPGRSNPPN